MDMIYFDIPQKCPICGGDIQIRVSDKTENLYCLNAQCPGKLINRLEHFCGKKGLDIKGLSQATLEKLINWGWVNNFKDILKLQEHKDEWIKKPGFGTASVTKILFSIQLATHPAWLWRVIAAAGIPLIGSTASKALEKNFCTYAAFRKAVEDDFDFTELSDFGEATKQSILNFDYTDIDDAVFYGIEIKQGSSPIDITQSEQLKDIKVCITGKLKLFKNRDELKNLIKSLGGKTTETVINATCLINNNIDSTSSKNKAAKLKNIPILTEEDFISRYNIKL